MGFLCCVGEGGCLLLGGVLLGCWCGVWLLSFVLNWLVILVCGVIGAVVVVNIFCYFAGR